MTQKASTGTSKSQIKISVPQGSRQSKSPLVGNIASQNTRASIKNKPGKPNTISQKKTGHKIPPRQAKPVGRGQTFLESSDQYPILLFPVRLEIKFMAGGKELWVRVFPDDIVIETHERELTRGEVLAGRRFLSTFQKVQTFFKQAQVSSLHALTDGLGPNWDQKFQALPENSPQRQALWPAYSNLKKILEEEEQKKKAAWRELASKFGPERAVWISRQVPAYKSTNLENLREDEWTSAAKVRVFPDYFEFNIYDENDQVIDKYRTKGQRIPNELPLMAEAQNVTSKKEKTDLILKFFNAVKSENELMERVSEVLGIVSGGYLYTTVLDKAKKTITHKRKPRPKLQLPFATVAEIEKYWNKSLIDPKSKYDDIVETLYAIFIKKFETSLFDDKARWLEDIDAAVENGMAVKIKLTDVQPPFKRIIAVGVKESLNETASAKLLEELFENHRYTEGFGFVEPGTPTNNTNAVKSGHSESTEDYDRTFDFEFGSKNELNEDKARDPRRWDNRLKKYLGFDRASEVFSRCEHAERWEDSYQEYMNGLFWGITGEYYFNVMLGRLVPDSPALWSNLREHVRKNVRPLGLLPSMRIGNLPYGVLPVTYTPNWSPFKSSEGIGFGRGFSIMLNNLFSQWLRLAENSARIPRIGNTSHTESDPNQNLLQILGMEPSARSYMLRLYSDRRFLEWWAFETLGSGPSINLDEILKFGAMIRNWERVKQQSQRALQDLGVSVEKIEETLLFRLWGWDDESEYARENPFSFAIHKDTQGDQSSPPVFGGIKDRIEGRSNSHSTSPPDTLLYKLLYFLPRDEQGLILLTDDLKKLIELDDDPGRQWIERLFVGYLDAITHRLDAWITSLAHKRLEEMRQRNKDGIYLGAYGCLEDLSPKANGLQPKITRVSKANGEGGYIHAPSLNHASAAAVLRNAFLTFEGQEQNRPFAINLTSTRIRRACRLLAGLREGQPLGALLGYQIERDLHEKQLDQYIDKFRELKPFSGKGQVSNSQETLTPRNVVDGLALVQAIRLGPNRENLKEEKGTTKKAMLMGKEIGVTDIETGDGPELMNVLSNACDSIDAMTDLLLNESIYQWVQGKFEHAGAALQTMSGQAKPPEVESIKTPVTGITVRHRVAVIFSHSQAPQTKQSDEDVLRNIRGAMEPILNHWFGALIGSTANISCRVRFQPESGRGVGYPTAAALQMYPLDILFLSKFELPANNSSTEALKAEESPVEQWIRSSVRSAHELSPQARVEIDFDSTREPGHRTFRQLFYLAQQVLKLFGQSTKLTPDKWVRPEEVDSPVVEFQWKRVLQELNVRIQAIGRQVDTLLGTLVDPKQTNIQMIETLMRVTRLGVMGVIPSGSMQENSANLKVLREKAHVELFERKEKYTDLINDADQLSGDTKYIEGFQKEWQVRQEAIQVLFGKDFILIPQCWVPNRDEVKEALKKGIYPSSTSHPKGTENAESINRLWAWFHQAAQTHPSLRKLEDTLMYVDAWNASTAIGKSPASLSLQPQIVQLPFSAEHHWIGLSQDERKASVHHTREMDEDPSDEEDFPRGALSIMVFSSDKLALNTQPVSGVLLDDFTEVIPHADVQTGVAFQYNQPNSQPPHACLLAVPSQWGGESGHDEGTWSLEEVRATVKESMDLAKIRAVDFDALGKIQFLAPGLFLPVFSQGSGIPHEAFFINLDYMTPTGPILGKRLFLPRYKHGPPEIQIFSHGQNIRKHKIAVKSKKVRWVGFQFAKEGFEVIPKWPLKSIVFQIVILNPFNKVLPEVFQIIMTLFNPKNGVFTEKTEILSISTPDVRIPEISRGSLEVKSDHRIVQVRIWRPYPSPRTSRSVLLESIKFIVGRPH